MAVEGVFQGILEGGNDVFNMFYDFWYIWLGIIFIVGFILWRRKEKNFPLKCVIFERRGDDLITNLKEKVGKFTINGLIKWKFKKSKDTIPCESYAYLTKCFDSLGCAYFIKYGTGQYKTVDVRELLKHYCKECLTECIEIKDQKELERIKDMALRMIKKEEKNNKPKVKKEDKKEERIKIKDAITEEDIKEENEELKEGVNYGTI